MVKPPAGCLAAIVIAFALAAEVSATEVGGGGSQSRDCLVTLDADVNTPALEPHHVRCVDGDPACDADGSVNGVCEFDVAVCANSTFDPACSLAGVQSITVEHALDNGDPKFDPDFQALQTAVDNGIAPPTSTSNECTAPTTFRVPIKGPLGAGNSCGSNRKKLKITSLSQVIGGKVITDRDRLKLTCLPEPNAGCEPLDLFSGTFDRIQRQVFSQSCAVSGCHDSQSQSGDLLLEFGAAYGNLVNQPPNNFAANAAGWLRVDVVPDVSGDPSTSFLYRKIEGDLPDGTYGARMPFNRPKLPKTLREIIRLWIESGAPQTGWVGGTF